MLAKEVAIKRRFFGPVEIMLLVGILVFAGAGVTYAAVAGFITIPGVPALLADQVIQPPTRQLASPSPADEDIDSTPSPEATSVTTTTPGTAVSPSTTPMTTPTAPSSPIASPSVSPSPDAKVLAKQRDEQRLTVLVPKLQVALKDYQKKHGSYPKSMSYVDSWTNLPTSPLQVLVAEKYIDALPVDPQSDRKIGYRSVDGKSYVISVTLEDTSRPGGSFVIDDQTGVRLYVYTISFP